MNTGPRRPRPQVGTNSSRLESVDQPGAGPKSRGFALRADSAVRQIAFDLPASQAVFRRYGETDRPRAKFGHLEPLERFARRHGVLLGALLEELSAATGVPIDPKTDQE